MQVFLSWSGQRSRAVADALARWLPRVINAVEPWISTRMEKGVRGGEEIADALGLCRFGILCLTRDNLKAPWILYEAGALSKTKNARVCTLLLDLNPSDIEQPLAQFQHTVATRDDILQMIRTINNVVRDAGERGLPDTVLEEQFTDLWPKLDTALKTVPVEPVAASHPVRSDREVLEEILGMMRIQQREVQALGFQLRPGRVLPHRRKMDLGFPFIAWLDGGNLEAATPILNAAVAEGIITEYQADERAGDPSVLSVKVWAPTSSPARVGSVLRHAGLPLTRIQRLQMPIEMHGDMTAANQIVADTSEVTFQPPAE